MKKEDVKTVLEAFYAGETSVEQEQELLRYFENENIEGELLNEKELFRQMYHHSETIKVPEKLKAKLTQLIDQLSENEVCKANFGKTRRIWVWASSAAACLVIAVASGFYLNYLSQESQIAQQKQIKGIIIDPKEAQIEAERALILVSRKFNKGTEKLALVSTSFHKSNEILEKKLKTISHEN